MDGGQRLRFPCLRLPFDPHLPFWFCGGLTPTVHFCATLPHPTFAAPHWFSGVPTFFPPGYRTHILRPAGSDPLPRFAWSGDYANTLAHAAAAPQRWHCCRLRLVDCRRCLLLGGRPVHRACLPPFRGYKFHLGSGSRCICLFTFPGRGWTVDCPWILCRAPGSTFTFPHARLPTRDCRYPVPLCPLRYAELCVCYVTPLFGSTAAFTFYHRTQTPVHYERLPRTCCILVVLVAFALAAAAHSRLVRSSPATPFTRSGGGFCATRLPRFPARGSPPFVRRTVTRRFVVGLVGWTTPYNPRSLCHYHQD